MATVKQQMQEATREISREIHLQFQSLRLDVQNAIDIRQHVVQSISIAQPPPDSQIRELRHRAKASLPHLAQDLGLDGPPAPAADLSIPPDANRALSSRYLLEREVRRIWQHRFGDTRDKRILPFSEAVRQLVEAGVLPPRAGHFLREAYAVASPAVHAEPASQEQMGFLEDVVPSLLATLREIP